MTDIVEDMNSKRDLLGQRIKDRQVQRESDIKRNARPDDVNTEELVRSFYNEIDPEVLAIEELMTSIVNDDEAEDKSAQLNEVVAKIQQLQDKVSDAGIFLPSYDSKKCQHTISDLNNKYQELVSKVKPKKKFGFKNRKQKTKLPEVSELSISETDSAGSKSVGYSTDDGVNVSDRRDERIVLSRDQVQGRDVVVSGLTNCRLEIRASPLTLHLTNISSCTVLTGPVATSIMVDQCVDSSLSLSCQQLRTHNTSNTDIYLHTTAKAIIEDCKGIRVAPYNWKYPDMEEDWNVSKLDKNINNWTQIGDFNWLSVDKPSPNWSILPQQDIVTEDSTATM